MKKVKCFVLSLLVCFSFGCVRSENAQSNLKFLLSNMNDIENYSCVRTDMDEPFVCVLETKNNETKLVECNNSSCTFIKCDRLFCFQSNDTE